MVYERHLRVPEVQPPKTEVTKDSSNNQGRINFIIIYVFFSVLGKFFIMFSTNLY